MSQRRMRHSHPCSFPSLILNGPGQAVRSRPGLNVTSYLQRLQINQRYAVLRADRNVSPRAIRLHQNASSTATERNPLKLLTSDGIYDD